MAWYDEAVFYHIYPLGLTGAPKENDYGEPVHRLRDVFPWIDHVKKLGVNAIYIGPLFESVGHGYETTDYKKLDSRLGDNADLTEFVRLCHEKDIRVILDGVFNHTGRDFFAFKDIQQNREGSQYRDWYCNVNFGGNNEYNDGFSYENWGGYNLLVKLNQHNPAVKDYICDVIRFWVSEFDIDGIRLDAADVLDFGYMQALRAVANEVKPDFWLMGEVIHGDYTRWVNEGTLHSVTNYHLHKALYSGNNDHNFFEIAHTVKRLYDMGGNRPGGLKLYNFVDNHDVERIYTKLNNKAHYGIVHILEYTLPGVPSIYYGSEFGIEGRKEKFSDDSLRPALKLPDFADSYENNPCTKLICALGRIRNSEKALSYGSYEQLTLTNRQYAYARDFEGERVLIAVNNDDNGAHFDLPAGNAAEYVGLLSGKKVPVNGGRISFDVDGNSGDIFAPVREGVEAQPVEVSDVPENIVVEEVKNIEIVANVENVIDVKDVETVKTTETVDVAEAVDTAETADSTEATESTDITGATEIAETAAADVVMTADAAEAAKTEDAVSLQENESSEVADDKDDTKAEEDKAAPVPRNVPYEEMTVAELQQAILAKMAANGPVTDYMKKTVDENTHHASLINWVKSFR